MQHVQNANGTWNDEAHHSPCEIARAGLWTHAGIGRIAAITKSLIAGNMKLRVKLFAVAKDLAGCEELEIESPEGATVAHVREAVERACPALARVLPHALWAVDAAYATDNTCVNE